MRRKSFGLLFLVFTAGCASWFRIPDPGRFRGGEIAHFEGPYIFARLPQFSLRQSSEYSQQFSRFPLSRVTVYLEVSDPAIDRVLSALPLTTRITMEVTNNKRRRICRASGFLVNQGGKHDWEVFRENRGLSPAQLSNPDCTKLELDYDRPYTMKLSVENLDPRTPDMILRPVIGAHMPDLP